MEAARPPRIALAHVVLLALVGCSSIETFSHKEDRTDFDVFRTYAWLDIRDAFPTAEPELVARARETADAELRARGMSEVSRDEAELLLDLRADVEPKVRYRDPYFAFYTIERYEDGTLTVTAIDPVYDRDLWAGTARAELRETARGFGLMEPRFVDTDEERDWPIEAMVRSLFDEFPPRTRREPTTVARRD